MSQFDKIFIVWFWSKDGLISIVLSQMIVWARLGLKILQSGPTHHYNEIQKLFLNFSIKISSYITIWWHFHVISLPKDGLTSIVLSLMIVWTRLCLQIRQWNSKVISNLILSQFDDIFKCEILAKRQTQINCLKSNDCLS